jgi:cell volume regulation protein A
MIARWLNLAEKPLHINKLKYFDVDFSNEISSTTTEIIITNELIKRGNRLKDLGLPENTLAVMVKRSGKFFVPTGKTTLMENDKLLMITDNQEALNETYKTLGL